jgi:Ca-activated chloride channel homolog
MINYFTYDYPEPTGEELLSLDVEVAGCPWADSHRLVRIGLKGHKTTGSETRPTKIAKEVKIQVEFNPAEVASYHLLGYEQQMLGKESLNRAEIDAGEIEAGHTVTAFYEVLPAVTGPNPEAVGPEVEPRNGPDTIHKSNEMLTVNLRYKKPNNDKSELIQQTVIDDGKKFASASSDFKFAAAVAEFAMLLHESEFTGNGTFGAVLEWAEEGKGIDANGYRAGFLELVRKTEVLNRG